MSVGLAQLLAVPLGQFCSVVLPHLPQEQLWAQKGALEAKMESITLENADVNSTMEKMTLLDIFTRRCDTLSMAM